MDFDDSELDPIVQNFFARLPCAGLVVVLIVAAICWHLATPVQRVGVTIPIFAPPIAAALAAMVVSWRNAAPLAYIGGSLGTLIGADLLNLPNIQALAAPVASIGGAGTFDGIFVAGIMAVLFASFTGSRRA